MYMYTNVPFVKGVYSWLSHLQVTFLLLCLYQLLKTDQNNNNNNNNKIHSTLHWYINVHVVVMWLSRGRHVLMYKYNCLLGLNEATQPPLKVSSTGSAIEGEESVEVVLLLMRCIGRRTG